MVRLLGLELLFLCGLFLARNNSPPPIQLLFLLLTRLSDVLKLPLDIVLDFSNFTRLQLREVNLCYAIFSILSKWLFIDNFPHANQICRGELSH